MYFESRKSTSLPIQCYGHNDSSHLYNDNLWKNDLVKIHSGSRVRVELKKLKLYFYVNGYQIGPAPFQFQEDMCLVPCIIIHQDTKICLPGCSCLIGSIDTYVSPNQYKNVTVTPTQKPEEVTTKAKETCCLQ